MENQKSMKVKIGSFWTLYDEDTGKHVIAMESIPLLFDLETRLYAASSLNIQILTNPIFSAPGLTKGDVELAEEICGIFCKEDALKRGLVCDNREVTPDEHYFLKTSDEGVKKKMNNLGIYPIRFTEGNPVYYIKGEVISERISNLVSIANNILEISERIALRYALKNGKNNQNKVYNHKEAGGGS